MLHPSKHMHTDTETHRHTHTDTYTDKHTLKMGPVWPQKSFGHHQLILESGTQHVQHSCLMKLPKSGVRGIALKSPGTSFCWSVNFRSNCCPQCCAPCATQTSGMDLPTCADSIQLTWQVFLSTDAQTHVPVRSHCRRPAEQTRYSSQLASGALGLAL